MKEQIKCNVSRENICAYILIDGKLCTADCNPSFEEENSWYVSRVFVHESFRCRGIGKLLLEKMFEEVKNVGGSKIIVYPGGYSVDEDRQINFYKQNGFEEITKGKLIKKL